MVRSDIELDQVFTKITTHLRTGIPERVYDFYDELTDDISYEPVYCDCHIESWSYKYECLGSELYPQMTPADLYDRIRTTHQAI
jgi:hypothetical protein